MDTFENYQPLTPTPGPRGSAEQALPEPAPKSLLELKRTSVSLEAETLTHTPDSWC